MGLRGPRGEPAAGGELRLGVQRGHRHGARGPGRHLGVHAAAGGGGAGAHGGELPELQRGGDLEAHRGDPDGAGGAEREERMYYIINYIILCYVMLYYIMLY